MNFWVCTVGMYRATAIISRVHTAFFNYHSFCKVINMSYEIVLARIMTALDLEFERALHHHDEGYESDNDYDLPGPFLRPVCVYLVSMTEAFLNPKNYKGVQGPTSPSTPSQHRDDLPFCQAVWWWLAFSKTPPSEMDSDDDEEEDFSTAEFNDPVWSEEPIPKGQQLCIHQIPYHWITGHSPRPGTLCPQPIHEEVLPEEELMDISILHELPDVINVPKELSSYFDSWHRVCSDINGEMTFEFGQ